MRRLLILLLVFALFSPAQAVPQADIAVYADGLGAGWENWSWDTTLDPAATAQVHAGTYALAVTYTAGWGGVSLHTSPALDTAEVQALTFWAYGGSGGAHFNLSINQTDAGGQTAPVALTAPAGSWTQFTLSLSQLGNPATIARLNLQENTGATQAQFFLDDMRFTTTALPPISSSAIGVDMDQTTHSFTPQKLLGVNAAAWGGDALKSPQFVARTQAMGGGIVRIPGGSWSQSFGWLSCELGSDVPGALPCGLANSASGWFTSWTEFIDLLQATSRPALFSLNANASWQELAATVAFFNGSPSDTRPIDPASASWHTVGYWAQVRADHGNAAPFHITFWEYGNENYGGLPNTGAADCVSYGWETTWTCDGTEYVNGNAQHPGFLTTRQKLLGIDSSIKVGIPGLPDPAGFNNWGNEVLDAAGSVMDFYAIHPYTYNALPPNSAAGWNTILAVPQTQWASIRSALASAFAAHAGGRAIPVFVTEYNLTSGWPNDNAQLMTRTGNALFIADIIGQMAVSDMALGNQWLLNGNTSDNGTDYGLLRMNEDALRSPQYYAFKLWDGFGSRVVAASSVLDAGQQLSVYAGSPSSRVATLLVINKTATPIDTALTLRRGGAVQRVVSATASVYRASDPTQTGGSFNGVVSPSDDLSNAPPQTLAMSGTTPHYTFAPFSVTLLRITIAAPAHSLHAPILWR